jgi:hypothetical protein
MPRKRHPANPHRLRKRATVLAERTSPMSLRPALDGDSAYLELIISVQRCVRSDVEREKLLPKVSPPSH